MAKFLNTLTITVVDDQIFKVSNVPFRYESDLVALVTVPIGFQTDFASVPRIGMIYAMLGDCAHEPAVIHDYLYFVGTTSRSLADKVLLEAMGVIGLPFWRRWPIYSGVRIGGWVAWNGHRKAGHGTIRTSSAPF